MATNIELKKSRFFFSLSFQHISRRTKKGGKNKFQ